MQISSATHSAAASGVEPRPALARAMVTPRGFEGKQFDVVELGTRSAGHSSLRDALDAVFRLGQGADYEVIGIVERPDATFDAVGLVTVDEQGRFLNRLPLPLQELDWIARVPDTPLRAVHLLGSFGGPVRLLDSPPAADAA